MFSVQLRLEDIAEMQANYLRVRHASPVFESIKAGWAGTPPVQSVDREREEKYRSDIENSIQTAAEIVEETLAAERAALAEQQVQLRMKATLLEIGRTQVPGQDSLGRPVQHVLDFNTEATRRHNVDALLNALDPGDEPTLETFKEIITDPRNKSRFAWIVSVTAAQRKQQDQQRQDENRRVFAEAARKFGFAEIEANFNVLQGLGDFDIYQIGQAIQSNAVMLAPATEADRQRWAAERAEQRNDFLQNKATTPELRRIANQESVQGRAAAASAQADASYQASVLRDQATGGYRSMPDTFRGEPLTKEFLLNRRKCSTETLKQLIRLYGEAQVTARLRGIA